METSCKKNNNTAKLNHCLHSSLHILSKTFVNQFSASHDVLKTRVLSKDLSTIGNYLSPLFWKKQFFLYTTVTATLMD